MALAANIVIADAAGTPVNHTFVPTGKDTSDVFWFTDRSQLSPIGYWKISIEYKQPPAPKVGESSSNRTIRVRVGLHEPVLETLSNSTVSGILPAPTVAYIPRSFLEFVIPERASLLDRQNLRKMIGLLATNAQIVDLVDNLNPFSA